MKHSKETSRNLLEL